MSKPLKDGHVCQDGLTDDLYNYNYPKCLEIA